MISFKRACDMTIALSSFLAIGMVFFPQWTISVLGVDIQSTGEFVTRRMGLLFLGLFVLMLCSRSLEDSSGRVAIARSVVASMSTLAVLGVIEFARGNAGLSIIYVAVLIEVVLTVAFFPYAKLFANKDVQG